MSAEVQLSSPGTPATEDTAAARPATDVLIRKYGTSIEIGMADGSPITWEIAGLLAPRMTYMHIDFLRGADRYDPITGLERNIRTRKVYLYDISHGVIRTLYGYLPRTFQTLQQHGISVALEDLTPPSPRPDCYVPDWDNLYAHIRNWRYRQEECVRMITQSWGGLINAPPAFGKSFLIACLGLLYRQAKIDVVTRRKDVVQRTVRDLRRFLPSVGQVGGGRREHGRRVTVYVAKSAKHSPGDADLLFCDEAHELMAPSYSDVLAANWRFSRNFAFTATPDGRADNADAKIEMLFGPEIFYMSWQEATENGLIVPVKVRWLPIQMDYNPAAGKSDVPKKRWGLWRNDVRNAALATAARWHPDEQVLILVETFEHAVYLWQHLPEFTLCYDNVDADVLEMYQRNRMLPEDFEPMTPRKREELRREFEAGRLRKAIATDIWSTGVSFEQLSVLVRADARTSAILDDQAPGRVVRIHEESGKTGSIVYDADDVFDEGFKRGGRKRYRNYAAKGWEQERVRLTLGAPT